MNFKALAFAAISLILLAGAALADSPSISGIPDIEIEENSDARDRVLNLLPYASDNEDDDEDLFFDITDQSDDFLIYCFVDEDHYISCDAPEEDEIGTSTITVEVTDSDGDTDEDTFRVTVSGGGSGSGDGDAPDFMSIPDVEIEENSGYSDRLIDLFDYVDDDEDSQNELDFRIDSQSNTALVFCRIVDDRYFECEAPREDRTGTSTIVIEAEDTENNTSSDTFRVNVVSEGISTCSQVRVSTSTIFMDEQETERVTFDIRNDSDEDFEITALEVSETSPYITVGNADYPDTIDADGTGELSFTLRSLSVSGDREATVSIEMRGHFDGDNSCGHGDIPAKSFRVVIDEGGSGSGNAVCSDISIEADDITVNENSGTTRTFEISNDSDRTFNISTIRAMEDSSDVSIGVVKRRSSIAADDSEEFELNINTDSVPRTIGIPFDLTVTGSFSGGRSCSTDDIEESYELTIRDDSYTPPAPQPSPQPSPQPIPAPIVQVRADDVPQEIRGTGRIILENTGDDLANVAINAANAPEGVTFGSVSKQLWVTGEKIAISVDTGGYEGNVAVNLRITASEGTRTLPIQFRAEQSPQDGAATGFLNLATTVGTAIGLLIVVILAIVGVVSLVTKK